MINFRKIINSYPELQVEDNFNIVLNYMRTGDPRQIPAHLQGRMFDRYGPNGDFITQDNKIFYADVPNHNLIEVVKPSQINDKLEEIYNDDELFSTGLGQFYKIVSSRYLNIKKRDSDEFLKAQGNYQVGRVPPLTKTINKIYRPKTSNERWAIDLIDMQAYNTPGINGNKKYIFSCIDMYSGKVWCKAISNRDNSDEKPTLSNALSAIMTESNTTPGTIQCDSEFSQGNIKTFIRDNHIKLIKTPSYKPTSNGKIERMNRVIRQKIKSFFVRNNNYKWVDILQTAVNNINNQISKNESPNDIWTPGYIRGNHNQNHFYNLVRLQPERIEEPIYYKNDLVRVRLGALNSKIRKRQKSGFETKKNAIHYSLQIYKIFKVYRGSRTEKRKYALLELNIDGVQETASGLDEIQFESENDNNNRYQKFYASDLISVGTRDINEVIHTDVGPKKIERALTINRIK